MLKSILLIFLAFGASKIRALDLCPVYQKIHDKDVLPRIKSGIPLRLLSIAASDQSFKVVVRIEYDLWNELITVERQGAKKERCKLPESAGVICRLISFPEAPGGRAYEYRLLLNPVIGDRLKTLQAGQNGSGKLIEVNWARLIQDLETEKVLISEQVR